LTVFNVSWQITNALFQLLVTNQWGSILSGVVSITLPPNLYAASNVGGNNFQLYLSGPPNTTNRIWATTNLLLPLAQWQVIATNITDGGGQGQFLDTNTVGTPTKYYRLSSP
jgi:hypothetical protein